ncbi:MAG: helix-turn-helix transcriptional regulator [Planctomycetes bacterium]|nr:helix-turn-helix transcriptional regulator [Planctomycetota bacterium]MBI3833161.1 helix-turn-helix transcriptional regulator [Planctomycetota bacterium]
MGREETEQTDCLPDLFTVPEWRLIAAHLGLSDQQGRIARWICRGISNKAIAGRLGVSHDTIRTHTRVLYRKLRITTRVGVPVRSVLAARKVAQAGEL